VIVRINGEERELVPGTTVADVVAVLAGAEPRGVAVALDGEVGPRSAWATTDLREGHALEVLVAVAGG
jgi:sulfur carrier protein